MSTKKADRPPASLNRAEWRTSKAKDLVAQDIIDGNIPLEGDINPEEIFQRLYADNPLFSNFPFDKTRYKDRIERLRNAIGRLQHWAAFDSEKVLEDIAKHTPHNKNIRGELRWDGSEAQQLLKQDVEQGRHLQLKPRELRETREEYKVFGLRVFQKHIDQQKQALKAYDKATTQKRYKRMNHGDKTLSRNNQPSSSSTSTNN
jgi:hypothetical protein